MGRTQRLRLRKQNLQFKNINLDHEESTVNLKKWLKENNFSDPLNLQLRNFTPTGRGFTSKTSVNNNDVLIRVPLDVMITFNTIQTSGLLQCLDKDEKFSTHTLLAFYLAMEKHKREQSLWKNYINTLPDPEPVLPWMCDADDINIFPEDLKLMAKKLQDTFNENFRKLSKSIVEGALCECCKNRIHRVLTRNLFKWAWVLVNTRTVYIDPEYITSTNNSILSDEPSMALCPFLDMFNHSHLAQTVCGFVNIQGQSFCELRTMVSFKKYEQFFISYGSHDNVKLLMEYGFFIPGNIHDSVKFSFKDLINVLKLSFDERQYRFIKRHKFDVGDIFINFNEVSFNLKSILFIGNSSGIVNCDIIFSGRYPSEFDLVMRDCTKRLLDYKLELYQKDFDRFSRHSLGLSDNLKMIKDFLKYRVRYVKDLMEKPLYL